MTSMRLKWGEGRCKVGDVMVLENSLDGGWVRRVRLMADTTAALDEWFPGNVANVPEYAVIQRFEDNIHLQHLEASWSARELIRVPLSHVEAYWQVVAWWVGTPIPPPFPHFQRTKMEKGSLTQAIVEAAARFALTFGVDPMFGFMRTMPSGAAEFVEVKGICLMQAWWVPEGFVAVTSGGMWRNLQSFRVKKDPKETVTA